MKQLIKLLRRIIVLPIIFLIVIIAMIMLIPVLCIGIFYWVITGNSINNVFDLFFVFIGNIITDLTKE